MVSTRAAHSGLIVLAANITAAEAVDREFNRQYNRQYNRQLYKKTDFEKAAF